MQTPLLCVFSIYIWENWNHTRSTTDSKTSFFTKLSSLSSPFEVLLPSCRGIPAIKLSGGICGWTDAPLGHLLHICLNPSNPSSPQNPTWSPGKPLEEHPAITTHCLGCSETSFRNSTNSEEKNQRFLVKNSKTCLFLPDVSFWNAGFHKYSTHFAYTQLPNCLFSRHTSETETSLQ